MFITSSVPLYIILWLKYHFMIDHTQCYEPDTCFTGKDKAVALKPFTNSDPFFRWFTASI